jgi:hypothetical protein
VLQKNTERHLQACRSSLVPQFKHLYLIDSTFKGEIFEKIPFSLPRLTIRISCGVRILASYISRERSAIFSKRWLTMQGWESSCKIEITSFTLISRDLKSPKVLDRYFSGTILYFFRVRRTLSSNWLNESPFETSIWRWWKTHRYSTMRIEAFTCQISTIGSLSFVVKRRISKPPYILNRCCQA